ncbi:MAG: hypothetical protein IPK87_00730 [Planctomycetes bacterium]|nr:hypothetical protein [Planctomycetota bacterium]
MLLHPATLKHHVAAANRSRYALNTIALMPGGTLSTDGHSLLFTPYPDADPQEAPKIDGIDPKSAPPKAEPFLLSLDDAAKAAAMLGKPKRHAPPMTQFIQADVRQDSIVLGVTDLSNTQGMTARRVEGVFPEVGGVIPDYAEAKAITVNIDQLLRSLKALRGVTQNEVVTLRIIDDQQALGFSCKDGTAMLCMPVQVDRPEEHVPDQLAKLRDDGPGVAAPAEPDEEDEEAAVVPTEQEMEAAQAVYDDLPTLPVVAPQQAAKPRRRRRKSTPVEGELAEIIGG